MNELCTFLLENFWMILLITGMLATKRGTYGITLIFLILTIGDIHPIVLFCIIALAIVFPEKTFTSIRQERRHLNDN